MEIRIEVMRILPSVSFSGGDGVPRTRHGFLGRTVGSGYPSDVKFDVLGDERWRALGLAVGGVYDVSFDLRSREWNGRFYTDVNVWKAVSADLRPEKVQYGTAIPPEAKKIADGAENGKKTNLSEGLTSEGLDDLPF